MNRWDSGNAWAWYTAQPWLVGCNFIPSTAVNQLEMWQAETYDRVTINRELGWASDLGMNTVRIYLHDLAWSGDAVGFTQRLDDVLGLADRHGIRAILVIFDDCWTDHPRPGKQPEPIPGVHNSGWLQSPGTVAVNTPSTWGRLEAYVRDVVSAFGSDPRVLLWDLYNEPGNSHQEERSLPLLCNVFEWARQAMPSQPLTAGLWFQNPTLNTFQTEASDVISFHNYDDAGEKLADRISELRRYDRPLICTEWLRRGHSDVAACLPVFQREGVGCFNWGLVSGRTQTIFPWGSPPGAPEPPLWFHDLLRKDGTPFSPDEIQWFKTLCGRQARKGTPC